MKRCGLCPFETYDGEAQTELGELIQHAATEHPEGHYSAALGHSDEEILAVYEHEIALRRA